jgi:hypothetical protein
MLREVPKTPPKRRIVFGYSPTVNQRVPKSTVRIQFTTEGKF